MALTRRNTIVGLGALAAGAGVIGGTGAFTTVEAERDVNLETTGDSGAQLALWVANDSLGANDDVISLDVGDLNLNARTTFDNVLFLGNNGSQEVEISIYPSDGAEEDDLVGGVGTVQFHANSGDYDLNADQDSPDGFGNDDLVDQVTIDGGQAVMLDLTIDLFDENTVTDANAALDVALGEDDSIMIEANAVEE